MADAELRDRGPAGRGRRARRSCRASTSTVRSGEVHAVMGPNGSGKSTLSHVLMGRPGYEVLGGSVTLDGVDLLALPTVAAGPGRAVPRHAVPDRGARACRSRTCSSAAFAAAGRDTGRRSPRAGPAEAARIGFDERFLDRPLNVDLSGGEKKRNETLQLGVLAPEDRHPRRARLRPRRRRPAGLRPPGRGGHQRDRPRRAGHHPLQPAAPRAEARRRAHPGQGPHRGHRRARAGRASSRTTATPPGTRRGRRGRRRRPPPDPFADPFGPGPFAE